MKNRIKKIFNNFVYFITFRKIRSCNYHINTLRNLYREFHKEEFNKGKDDFEKWLNSKPPSEEEIKKYKEALNVKDSDKCSDYINLCNLKK